MIKLNLKHNFFEKLSSCAFFGVTAMVEAVYQIYKNHSLDASKQEVYDCVQSDADKKSCNGQHVAYGNWIFYSTIFVVSVIGAYTDTQQSRLVTSQMANNWHQLVDTKSSKLRFES